MTTKFISAIYLPRLHSLGYIVRVVTSLDETNFNTAWPQHVEPLSWEIVTQSRKFGVPSRRLDLACHCMSMYEPQIVTLAGKSDILYLDKSLIGKGDFQGAYQRCAGSILIVHKGHLDASRHHDHDWLWGHKAQDHMPRQVLVENWFEVCLQP